MSTQVLTANRLRDGAVVYLTPSGFWSERVGDAATAETPETAESLLADGHHAVRANEVVDVYLLPLVPRGPDKALLPARLRELIRAKGPTARPDLARADLGSMTAAVDRSHSYWNGL